MSRRSRINPQLYELETAKEIIGDAMPLYAWCVRHVTKEYRLGSFPLGAVEDLRTYDDGSLQYCLRRVLPRGWTPHRGVQTVGRWRRHLSRMGFIVTASFDGGYNFVILTTSSGEQFSDAPLELPSHLVEQVSKGLKRYAVRNGLGELIYKIRNNKYYG